jgi:hypothetical protein
MGSGSSNASAYTYIETSVSSFIPGATVAGNVKILCEKPIQASQMTILLKCISEVRWTVRKTNRGGRKSGTGANYTQTYHDKRVILVIRYPIWNFQGQLPQGQFTIPFSIQLPTDLPPSFSLISGNSDGQGKNEYTFEAVIEGSNEVQAQQTIVWVSRLPKPNEAIIPVTSEANIKVTSCCCLKSGNVELRSTADRNLVMANDVLDLKSKINNIKNKHTVNKITSTLARRIRLKIPRGPDTSIFSHTGSTLLITGCLYGSHPVDIKPGQSDSLEVAMRLNLTDYPNSWMMPSITSEMIDCEYNLQVWLEFDNFCGCGIYSVELPIEVCNGMVAINTVFSPPPQLNVDWNPSILASAPISVQGIPSQPDMEHHNPALEVSMDQNMTRGDVGSGNKVIPKP